MGIEDRFGIDPGRPPRNADEEPEPEREHDDDAQLHPVAPLPAVEQPGLDVVDWTPETVGSILDAGALIPNGLTRAFGAGGPDDVYLFSDEDHRALDAPLSRYLNRHSRLRQLASGGDLAAAGIAFGAYAVRETGRAAAFRAEREEEHGDLIKESPTESGVGIRVGAEEVRAPRRSPGDVPQP